MLMERHQQQVLAPVHLHSPNLSCSCGTVPCKLKASQPECQLWSVSFSTPGLLPQLRGILRPPRIDQKCRGINLLVQPSANGLASCPLEGQFWGAFIWLLSISMTFITRSTAFISSTLLWSCFCWFSHLIFLKFHLIFHFSFLELPKKRGKEQTATCPRVFSSSSALGQRQTKMMLTGGGGVNQVA